MLIFILQIFLDIIIYFLCSLYYWQYFDSTCCTLADMSVGLLVKTLHFDQIMCFVRYTPLSQDPLFPQLYDKADGMRVLEGGGGGGG